MTRHMKILITLAALNLGGCATTIEVPTTHSPDDFLSEIRESPSLVHRWGRETLEADSVVTAGDSITVWLDGNASQVPLSSVAGFSTRSTGAGIVQGLGIGILAGAAFGALVGFADGDDPSGQFLSFTAGEKALLLGTGFGIMGAVTGAIVGGIIGQRTDYKLPRDFMLPPDPSEPRVIIIVPALELEDEELVTFVWKGKVVWLRKETLTIEKVPEGYSITMPPSVRAKLE